MGQMTFEDLRVNPTVQNAELPRLKRQAIAIYKLLQRGPLYTNQLRQLASQYNARIKELRAWLRKFGMTIDLTQRRPDGNNRYELRPYFGSHYQQTLLQKRRPKYETCK
jgi:hypothetical protein